MNICSGVELYGPVLGPTEVLYVNTSQTTSSENIFNLLLKTLVRTTTFSTEVIVQVPKFMEKLKFEGEFTAYHDNNISEYVL